MRQCQAEQGESNKIVDEEVIHKFDALIFLMNFGWQKVRENPKIEEILDQWLMSGDGWGDLDNTPITIKLSQKWKTLDPQTRNLVEKLMRQSIEKGVEIDDRNICYRARVVMEQIESEIAPKPADGSVNQMSNPNLAEKIYAWRTIKLPEKEPPVGIIESIINFLKWFFGIEKGPKITSDRNEFRDTDYTAGPLPPLTSS